MYNVAQCDMFKLIINELYDWDITVINVEIWKYKNEVEDELSHIGVHYTSLERLNEKYISQTVKQIKPDIVVVGNDDLPASKMFIQTATRMNIPTLLVQDGILSRNIQRRQNRKNENVLKYLLTAPYRFFRFIIKTDLPIRHKMQTLLYDLRYGSKWNKDGAGAYPGTGKCSMMAVFGETTKKMFMSEGINPEKIMITGNPKFDLLFSINKNDYKENICHKLGIPTTKNIILLLTSYLVEINTWTAEQRKEFVSTVARATAAQRDTILIIKIHPPLENENVYVDIVKKFMPHPIILKYAEISELLSACSIVITIASTVALEAMALKKPVIFVNLFNESDMDFYNNSGAFFVKNENELSDALENASIEDEVRNKLRDDFIAKNAYLQDGKSSKRIADLIFEMTKNKIKTT